MGCGVPDTLQVNTEQINDRLSICVLDTEQRLYLDQPLTEYKKKYPDVEIEIKTVAADDIENQRKEIAAELMAGEGADLYLNAGILISDIYKAQETGALEDLMPWFRKTEGFSEADYMEGTFDLYEHTESCYIFAAQITGKEIAVRKDMEKKLEIDMDSWLNSSDWMPLKYIIKNIRGNSHFWIWKHTVWDCLDMDTICQMG